MAPTRNLEEELFAKNHEEEVLLYVTGTYSITHPQREVKIYDPRTEQTTTILSDKGDIKNITINNSFAYYTNHNFFLKRHDFNSNEKKIFYLNNSREKRRESRVSATFLKSSFENIYLVESAENSQQQIFEIDFERGTKNKVHKLYGHAISQIYEEDINIFFATWQSYDISRNKTKEIHKYDFLRNLETQLVIEENSDDIYDLIAIGNKIVYKQHSQGIVIANLLNKEKEIIKQNNLHRPIAKVNEAEILITTHPGHSTKGLELLKMHVESKEVNSLGYINFMDNIHVGGEKIIISTKSDSKPPYALKELDPYSGEAKTILKEYHLIEQLKVIKRKAVEELL